MDSKTMNDLHKQLVDLNTSIKDVATKMSAVSDNTASTAKYSKAATGNRNA
jgi:beta-lactamase class A